MPTLLRLPAQFDTPRGNARCQGSAATKAKSTCRQGREAADFTLTDLDTIT